MNIFLSYSSKNRPKAEEIALALQAEGHEVFFDKDDLWGGENFNAVIRRQIADADLFLFLISPDSVRQGAYSLSELRLAREKWPSPKKHVMPMLLESTDIETIPAYLYYAQEVVSTTLATPIINVFRQSSQDRCKYYKGEQT